MTADTVSVDPPTVEQPAWLTPGEITIDAAMIALGDAGYEVTNLAGEWHAVVATFDAGVHHARVCFVEGRYWLVGQQRSEEDGRRIVVDEEWPGTLAAAVRRAVKLAEELAKAHDAEREPAVFGDEIQAAHDAEMTEEGAA